MISKIIHFRQILLGRPYSNIRTIEEKADHKDDSHSAGCRHKPEG